MRVAVTGATGFVGRGAVRHLVASGETVYAFGRRPPAVPLAGGAFRLWDLTTGPLVDPPVVDAVVHCAADVAAWAPEERAHQVNVLGTRHLLGTFPGARIVQISSASVYPPRGDRVGLREDAPYPAARDYLNAYGRTKMLAERLLLASDRPVAILRPRLIYGPGDTTLLPRLLAARGGRWLPLPGAGTNRLSITALDNLLQAIALALRYDGRGVFNIADDDTPTRDDLVRAILGALELPLRLVHLPVAPLWTLAGLLERLWTVARRASEPPLTRYAISNLTRTCTLDLTRARDLLGYRPAPVRQATLAAIAAAHR